MNDLSNEILSEINNNMHIYTANGLYLSNKQINVLEKNNINYLQFQNIKQLIMYLERILSEEINEELDNLSTELSEFSYYHDFNK